MPLFLPQEIMHQILSNIPTKQLCTLLPTSKSTYLDVTGILHARLETHLVSKGDHKLIVYPNIVTPLILVRSIPPYRSTKRTISYVNIYPYISRITPIHRLIILLLFTYPRQLRRFCSDMARKNSISHPIQSDVLIQSFS